MTKKIFDMTIDTKLKGGSRAKQPKRLLWASVTRWSKMKDFVYRLLVQKSKFL